MLMKWGTSVNDDFVMEEWFDQRAFALSSTLQMVMLTLQQC